MTTIPMRQPLHCAHGSLCIEVHARSAPLHGPSTLEISKLFNFNFAVEYRSGRLNTADALFRRSHEKPALAVLSEPTFRPYDEIRAKLQVGFASSATP